MLESEVSQTRRQVGIEFVWLRHRAAGFILRPSEHLLAHISKVATNLTHQPTKMSPIGITFYRDGEWKRPLPRIWAAVIQQSVWDELSGAHWSCVLSFHSGIKTSKKTFIYNCTLCQHTWSVEVGVERTAQNEQHNPDKKQVFHDLKNERAKSGVKRINVMSEQITQELLLRRMQFKSCSFGFKSLLKLIWT